MVFEKEKFSETPEEIIERRKAELYQMWSEKQMCAEELQRLEKFINDFLEQDGRPEETGDRTANSIVNEVKEVFGKYRLNFECIADAVLVYLFEVLRF